MKRLIFAVFALSLLVTYAISFVRQDSDATKAISKTIGALRGLEDKERAKVTKDLALQIRALPASALKVSLASSLANLATEGDFGQNTLQEVTTTLATALSETPPAAGAEPARPYVQLANLERYEGMKVSLDHPQYTLAKKKLDELEAIRAKADFTLTDLDGKTWTLSALKGSVVLVNFWATWCPPCRKEMPDLQKLYNEFKGQHFVILSISDETEDKVRPFLKEHGYTYPSMLDPGRKVNEMYKVDGIPKSFIYNREGKLVAQTIDMRTEGQFRMLLQKAGLRSR